MRTDRRTDMTKLIVAFRNFAEVPKNVYENVNELIRPVWKYIFVTCVFSWHSKIFFRNIYTLFLKARNSYKIITSHFSSFCSRVNQFFTHTHTHTLYTMKIETLSIDFVASEYSVVCGWE
jgi:hypothetical protein